MLTFEGVVQSIKDGCFCLTRDELFELILIVDNPLGNLEIDWAKEIVVLKGLNVTLRFDEDGKETP